MNDSCPARGGRAGGQHGASFAARPSGIKDIYKIYAESFQNADHLRRVLAEARAIVGAAPAAPTQQTETASGKN